MSKLKFLTFAMMITIIFVSGCSKYAEEVDFQDFEDLNKPQYMIGGQVGAASEPYIGKVFPNAIEKQFSNVTDLVVALEQKQIDAIVFTRGALENALEEKPDKLKILSKDLGETNVHMVISPNTKLENLENEINEFLEAKKADGTLEKAYNYWFIEHKVEMPEDIPEIQNPSKKIVIGTEGTMPPSNFYSGDKIIGFDIELVLRFAAEYGYEIEFRVEDFISMLTDAEFGKIDLISGSIMYTDERAERVIFPKTPLYTIPVSVMTRKNPAEQTTEKFEKLADLNNSKYKIAAVVGTASEPYVGKVFPNAEEKQFSSVSDMVMALEEGQVDGLVFIRSQLESVLEEKKDTLCFLEPPIGETEMHIVSSPNTKLKNLSNEINEFLKNKKADGTLDKMYQYWLVDHKTEMPEIQQIKPPTQKIIVGTFGTAIPTSFYVGEDLRGFDIELIKRFASEYGYEIEFRIEDIISLLADTEFGKIDIIAGTVMYTDERAERVVFPETPLYKLPISVMVRNESIVAEEENFFSSVKLSFEKTLIREDRYKMILSGLKVTLILSLGSLILGTIFGFVFCLLKRSNIKIISTAMHLFIVIISGLPIVLTLMICFYIVFADFGLNEIVVAIIAFSIDFGCYIAITLNSGIESVDVGEIEAAEALGLSKMQIYRKIIFPQAIQKIFGVYRRQVISLIKSTSIVGYIAVQDLTKVSDIIRARTYDAFFSLIFTAAIYFVIARICIFLLNLADSKLNRRK